jgi:hypothetical protein
MNTPFRFGPGLLTTTLTTNLLNPPTTTGGVNVDTYDTQILLSMIRVVNSGGIVGATFSLWLGATGANTLGTELAKDIPVPAFSYVDLVYGYPGLRIGTANFLVGGCDNAANALTIEGTGIIRVVG